MIERSDEETILKGFKEFLRNNKALKEKSIKDDISRIKMMKNCDIDYKKGEDCTRDLLYSYNLSNSSIRSCLRVCRYYQEYINLRGLTL